MNKAKKLKNIFFILWELIKTAVLTAVIYFLAMFIFVYADFMFDTFGQLLALVLMSLFIWVIIYIDAGRYYRAKAEYGAIKPKDVDFSEYPQIRRRNMRVWAFPLFGLLTFIAVNSQHIMFFSRESLFSLIPVFGAAVYSFLRSRVEMYEIKRNPESYRTDYIDRYKREYAGIESAKKCALCIDDSRGCCINCRVRTMGQRPSPL
ncbi:MAG: hypothetical protein J6A07_06870 [Firmicutes bacterium]|nr:hypothetical protein [Bacillota bacterium]